jgi:hypothetical protein
MMDGGGPTSAAGGDFTSMLVSAASIDHHGDVSAAGLGGRVPQRRRVAHAWNVVVLGISRAFARLQVNEYEAGPAGRPLTTVS